MDGFGGWKAALKILPWHPLIYIYSISLSVEEEKRFSFKITNMTSSHGEEKESFDNIPVSSIEWILYKKNKHLKKKQE